MNPDSAQFHNMQETCTFGVEEATTTCSAQPPFTPAPPCAKRQQKALYRVDFYGASLCPPRNRKISLYPYHFIGAWF
jgi:hypothetical protein